MRARQFGVIDSMSIALALIVFAAFTVEATAGFGSLMISLAIGTLIWPIAELLPVLVPTSLCLSLYLLFRYWRFADWKLLCRAVLPLMTAGMVLAIYVLPSASPELLRLLLGIVVTGAAVRGLWTLRASTIQEVRGVTIASAIWMIIAGMVHGLIASGGPPLVYALEGVGLDKRAFRSTLSVVWFLLNCILIVRYVAAGSLALEQGKILVMLLPVVAMAILFGEVLHSRVSERVFRASVFSLLVGAGFLLCVPVLWSFR